ncbi:cytochrome P450 [Paludibacterium paludis]|nr:cytochrome P450 [Paludibacterium paludis]
MKPSSSSSSSCPFEPVSATAPPERHPPGVWPPGPAPGWTGWRLLWRMSRDMPAMLAQWQREHGDVVHARIRPEHFVMVSDPERVRELLVANHDGLIRWERGMRVFSRIHGHSVLIAEGEAWHGKRHTLQANFSRSEALAFVPAITAAAERAMARWPARSEAWPIEDELTSLAMTVILHMVFSEGIGEEALSVARAVRVLGEAANKDMFLPASGPDWLPWKRARRQSLALLNGLIGRHVAARLALPRDAWPDDLLSRLLDQHRLDAAAWPLRAVRDECMTAFLAGHDTVAATLTWWTWCMAANPDAQAAAREEVNRVLGEAAPTAGHLASLACVRRTLQETMRLYPAAPVLFSRRSTRPVALGPWLLPEGVMFTVPVQLIHHDPRWFPEPGVFRPERFDPAVTTIPHGAYLPFGAGPRVCLGQHLALTEMTVVAALLLRRWAVSAPEGMVPPRAVMNVTLKPDRPLRLRLSVPPA